MMYQDDGYDPRHAGRQTGNPNTFWPLFFFEGFSITENRSA